MEDAKEAVKAFITEPIIQQRLAKYLVLECIRTSDGVAFGFAAIFSASAIVDCQPSKVQSVTLIIGITFSTAIFYSKFLLLKLNSIPLAE